MRALLTQCQHYKTRLSSAMPDRQQTALSLIHICAIFEDVSFRLLKGEHIGLVGANGEGKSTFMNMILRFKRYTLRISTMKLLDS